MRRAELRHEMSDMMPCRGAAKAVCEEACSRTLFQAILRLTDDLLGGLSPLAETPFEGRLSDTNHKPATWIAVPIRDLSKSSVPLNRRLKFNYRRQRPSRRTRN